MSRHTATALKNNEYGLTLTASECTKEEADGGNVEFVRN